MIEAAVKEELFDAALECRSFGELLDGAMLSGKDESHAGTSHRVVDGMEYKAAGEGGDLRAFSENACNFGVEHPGAAGCRLEGELGVVALAKRKAFFEAFAYGGGAEIDVSRDVEIDQKSL